MATPPGRLAPGDTWGRPAAWVGHRCKLSVSPEAGRTRFSGVAPGVASTHTKSHVKSEGGMGCTRVLPKSRVANPAVLGPAKRDLASKTNPEGTQHLMDFLGKNDVRFTLEGPQDETRLLWGRQ